MRPNDNKAYAKREKAYMQGTLFPDIKVGMTKEIGRASCRERV